MAIGDMVPWQWGGFRRGRDEGRSVGVLRSEMDALHREMERLFEGIWSGGAGGSRLMEGWAGDAVTPRLDITEDEKGIQVHVDLPGMDEKDVEVTLADDVLTIRGEKKVEKERKEEDYYRRERSYGSFCRRIEIPAAIDTAKVEASFKKGVLAIQLPKSKEAQAKTKHIEVKAA
jgi:HSP20 family protein